MQRNMRRRGGQRTCRPLDRGQNSTKCTSLRRALGIVGDSCQEHGESMQGREVSPVRSHPSHRTGAARRRQEPTRPASCHLNAPCAFSHVCRCPQRNRRGAGGLCKFGWSWRSPEKGDEEEERKMMESTSLKFFFKRIPNIGPCRSVNHGRQLRRSFSPHRQVKTRESAEANRAEALCPLWLPSGEDGHDCNGEISARGGERNPR